MVKKRIRIYIQKLKNLFWHLPKSIFYNFYYGFPSKKLVLIGITGTDGKTTSVNLLHKALLESGIKTGLISTLGAKIGDNDISVGLHTTSPDPSLTQKIFRRMVDEGITHAIIEVTAHAIDQYRYYGCQFKVCAITNTSHEHLDDFLDMQQYIDTKAKLFKSTENAVLNKDDASYKIITSQTPAKIVTYSINKTSDYQAKDIVITSKQLSFSANKTTFKTNSNYKYQIYNILLVNAILNVLKIDNKIILNLIKDFPLMKGRRETVPNNLRINCIIDFAHTPAALKTTLESLKSTTKGKVIVIFGATGGRDPSKRPIMGEVVSNLADIAIVTADDTRNELVENINKNIISGMNKNKTGFTYYDIPRRQDAFNLAIKLASSGDTVIACGKGHETTILHGNTEYPWSERDAFLTAFRQLEL